MSARDSGAEPPLAGRFTTGVLVEQSQRPSTDLQAALDSSACLGAWTHDVRADRLAIPPAFAAAVGLAAGDDTIGFRLDDVLAGIQSADRLRIESVLHAAAEDDSPFEAEFRTLNGARGARWIRIMGRPEVGSGSGIRRTRGLAFDLTEGRLAGRTAAQRTHRQVNQLADHVIAMQGLAAELRSPPLLRLVEQVAVAIGHELARCLSRSRNGDRS